MQVKLVVSGSWESALLKVTWPDDLPPDDDLVSFLQIQCLKTASVKSAPCIVDLSTGGKYCCLFVFVLSPFWGLVVVFQLRPCSGNTF